MRVVDPDGLGLQVQGHDPSLHSWAPPTRPDSPALVNSARRAGRDVRIMADSRPRHWWCWRECWLHLGL